MNSNSVSNRESRLRIGRRLLIHADTSMGTVRTVGKVIQIGDYSFRMKCDTPLPTDYLEPGQSVTVSLIGNTQVLPVSTGFIRMLDDEPDVMVIKLPSSEWRENRRAFFRGEVSLPITIVRGDGSRLEGVTGDISGGGSMIIMTSKLENGDEVSFITDIPDAGVVRLRARIVWANFDEQAGKGHYGLEFIEINRRDQNTICRFVMVKEFERRRQVMSEINRRSEIR